MFPEARVVLHVYLVCIRFFTDLLMNSEIVITSTEIR